MDAAVRLAHWAGRRTVLRAVLVHWHRQRPPGRGEGSSPAGAVPPAVIRFLAKAHFIEKSHRPQIRAGPSNIGPALLRGCGGSLAIKERSFQARFILIP